LLLEADAAVQSAKPMPVAASGKGFADLGGDDD
jgi:hypothetical protein